VDSATPRRWAEAAILGVILYVAIDVALAFLRPKLSVLHSAESDYGSEGPYAWLMDANFVLRCLLSLALAGALSLELGGRGAGRSGPVLIGVWALASGLLAAFPDDPAGTKLDGAGRVHLALAGIAFVAVVAGTFASGRAIRADPRFAPLRRPLLAFAWGAVVAIALLGHAHLRPHSLGGLYEKLFLGCELAWLLTVAVWLTRLDPARPGGRARR